MPALGVVRSIRCYLQCETNRRFMAVRKTLVGCHHHVIADHPYEGIIATAMSKGCDLIYMASHGRKGVSAVVLGSETHKVLTHAKLPVLVTR